MSRGSARLRKRGGAGDFVPDSKSFTTNSAVLGSGEQMSSGSEMRADDAVHLNEALRVIGRFEPAHPSLPLARRLMGVLSPVVQIPVLTVSDAGHHDSFGSRIAAQFVSNDDPWTTT